MFKSRNANCELRRRSWEWSGAARRTNFFLSLISRSPESSTASDNGVFSLDSFTWGCVAILQASRMLCRAVPSGAGFIGAEWIGAESVAGVGEGSSARSAADVAVFAGSALSVELVGRVQGAEGIGVAIDIDQRSGPDVAAMQRQKSRGINLAKVRDEDDPVAVANLESFVDGGRLHFRRCHAGGSHLVDGDAAIGRSFGGFHGEGRVHGEIEDPAHDAFAFFGRNLVEGLAASNRDQHEEAPAHDGEAGAQEFEDGGQVVRGFFRDERVDLDGKAEASAVASGFDGAIEGAGHGANVVVPGGAGAVEAESEALNAVGLQIRDGVVSQFGGGAGSDRDFQAEAVSVIDERENIFAAERIAAGENQVRQRITEADELPEEALAFFRRELQRIRSGHRFGATVFAGETAGLRHLPVDQHWIPGKIVFGQIVS